MILVTGFGPFPGVDDNPSAAAARAVDGLRVGGETIVGEVLPVSYARAPARVLALARALQPRAIVALGVATSRRGVEVERRARRGANPDRADVDGARRPDVPGPDEVRATLPVDALTRALRATPSDDAGRYVCNALLYDVLRGLPGVPAGFVHVPAEGIDRNRLLRGLSAVAKELA